MAAPLSALAQLSLAVPAAGDALAALESCWQHTPTLIELYSAQSKVLKHAGDPRGAATTADEARRLDLADRCTCLAASRAMA